MFHSIKNSIKKSYCETIPNPIFLNDIKREFEKCKYKDIKEIYINIKLLCNNTIKYYKV